MGTSRSAAELARKLHAAATAVDRGRTESVFDMSLVSKDELNRAFKQATGVTPGANSLNIGAGFDIKGARNPTSLLAMRGPAHWWESGTLGHPIAPKRFSGNRRQRGRRVQLGSARVSSGARGSGPRALRTPYGPRAHVQVRGMRPRPFWRQAKARIQKVAPQVLMQVTKKNILRAGFGR